MEQKLDIFQLHKPEDSRDARAWILASGSNLNTILKGLKEEILSEKDELYLLNTIFSRMCLPIFLDKNNHIRHILSNWISTKRKEMKLNQKHLCKLTGTSGSDWVEIENGKHIPSCNKLRNIIKVLGICPDFNFTCEKNDFCLRAVDYTLNSLKLDQEFIPIIVVFEILDIWKHELNKSEIDFENKKIEILQNVDFLKTNQKNSVRVKAVKEVDKNLAQIMGAFCADGNFYPPEMVRWEEEYKDNMEALGSWIDNAFGLKVKIERPVRSQKRNSWVFRFRNKVIARYLDIFFGFKPETKTYTVDEPEVIKKCSIDIRKGFAKGALMFDGSVNTGFTVSFSTMSKAFTTSIADILKTELDVALSNSPNRDNMWTLIVSLVSPKNKSILHYFEEGTTKWKRLNGFINGFSKSVKNQQDAYFFLDKTYPKIKGRNFSEILKAIPKQRQFDTYELMKKLKMSRPTLQKRLQMLLYGNIIHKERTKRNVYFFNKNTKEWRVPEAIDIDSSR